VYVLSSRWEGMPLVLVEAMSHGLPIVTSDIPVSQEILGDFGLYFKKGDVTDLAERLEEATHINWNQKSQEALEIAKRFDINNIIQRWNELIEND
jgi:glycosyltransferase involved in cell wall biosynthesis